jgi:iron complex outermembrane recepter protein
MKPQIKKMMIKGLLATTAIGPFIAFTPLFAAEQKMEKAKDADTVVVTARRREEALKDVPIAVSTFSASKIEATGAPDITILQQVSPNTTMQAARGTNSTLIAFIRGVGQQDPLWGFEPGVGLYVDDVYVARPQGAVLDIFDISRIEVLRGPQGSLYGRNTIGGAVKYVTKKLGHNKSAKARVSVGSYGQMDLVVSGTVPVGETLTIGGAFASYDRDGFGKNITTGADHYNKDVTAGRISAEWTPSDKIFVRASYDKTEDNSNAKHGHREAVGGGLTAGAPILANIYDTDSGMGSKNFVMNEGYSLTGEYKLSDAVTLKYIGAKRKGKTDSVIDFDTNQAKALDIPARYADDTSSHEVQALLSGDKLTGVVGAYYLDGMASGAFDTILGLLGLTTATSGQVDTKSSAVFADFSYNLSDNLFFSVGGRYTKDTRKGTVYKQNFVGLGSPLFGNTSAIGLSPILSNYTNERSFEEFTPRVSVSYKLNQDLTAYSAYSEGFKSGGFDMRGDASKTPATKDGYDPEYVKSYEIGLKGSLFDNRAYFSGAVFKSEYTGQQITRQEPNLSGGITSFVDNAGSSTIQGIELEGGATLFAGLSTTFGIGYTDAKFNEFKSFTLVGTTLTPIDLAAISKFQNTPEWNGNFALNYARSLGNNGKINANVTASYRSEYQMFEIAAPLLDQTKAYTLLDAGIAWTSPSNHVKASLTGRNLTNEHYKVGGYNFPGATFGNSITSYYGAPRTYTASIQYSF